MSCTRPIGVAALVDYWTDDPDLAIEDHAFECSTCAARLAAVGAICRGVGDVVGRKGGLTVSTTSVVIDRLAACGLTLRHYHAAPGDLVQCSVGASDDLVVAHLTADLADVERIDITVTTGGDLLKRFDDVPVDRATGELIVALGGDLVRTFPSMTFINRVIAVTPAGERTLAEYTFQHTAFVGRTENF